MHRVPLFLLLFGHLALGGCLAAAAGVAAASYGGVKYARNGAWQDYGASLDATWEATKATLTDMGRPVKPALAHGPTAGEICVCDAWVRVEQWPGGCTRVRTRFGTFENAENCRQARLLLDGIAQRLGCAQTQPEASIAARTP